MEEDQQQSQQRNNSGNKVIKVGESKSTSLSSSSSESSSKRFNTDTKFPKNILSKKKKKSIRQKNQRQRNQDHFILPVEEEGQQQDKNDIDQNQHKLPHFIIFNDRREFNQNSNQSRVNSKYQLSRCKSVGTLRLPRVLQQKKEQEERESKLHFSKINSLLDKNQFNIRKKFSDTVHFTSSENFQIYNKNFGQAEIIAEIGEIEQSKGSKNPVQKSMIRNQLEKIIVDEIDEKKKYRQQRQEPVIQSIMEERNDDDYIDEQLHTVLHKLHDEKYFIKKFIKSEYVLDDVLPIQNQNITLLTESIKEENEGENDN